VLSFGDVVELADYDAVVLGSGFYAGHWLAEARDWNAIAEWADTVADALSADQGNREERR
jgi:menaquinone-dependent protoporphyrinogen IX oxidase